jgi:hypothetical protein
MKSKEEKAFESALLEFLGYDCDRALTVLTGHFVAVTLEMVRRRVGEVEAENDVRIDGGRRAITIHAEDTSHD